MNACALARSLAVWVPAVTRYVDLLMDLMLVRRIPAFHASAGERLIKPPRTLIGDSGILHTLLGLPVLDDLIPHPVAGPSWQGFVMEKLISAAPPQTDAFRYRTRAGAGIDLLLRLPDRRHWAIGVKRKSAPKLSKGFRIAAAEP